MLPCCCATENNFQKVVIIWNIDKSVFEKDEDEVVLEKTRCSQRLKILKVSMFINVYLIVNYCKNSSSKSKPRKLCAYANF